MVKSLFSRLDGWWQGIYMACIAFPLYNVGAKFSIENYGVNPLIYLCFGSLFASLFLLLYSGRGRLALESLRVSDTWWFSFLNLAALSFGTSVFAYVSALQGSILIRVTSVVCFVIVLIMGQSSSKRECLLAMVAFSGVALMFAFLDIESKDKAVLFLLLLGASICQALRQILSEFHKTNISAQTSKEHAMVAGIVSAVSAMMFLCILVTLSIYQTYFGIAFFEGIPHIKDFFSVPSLLCSLIFSGTMIALAVYGEIYASKKISAKYLSSLIALMPMFVLIYECIFTLFTGNKISFSSFDILCMGLLILGNLGISVLAIMNAKNNKETELRAKYIVTSQSNVKHAVELVKSTMRFAQNDMKKVADILGVKESVIIDLIALEEDENYKLSEMNFDTLNKNYYINVSTKDSLTNITNRGNLEQQVINLIYQKDSFGLAFIDLDKFKQINDTLGHEAGDEVLKHVAKLMVESNRFGINARNGGDEFIMICFDDIKATVKRFEEKLAETFIYEQQPLMIKASIGLSYSQEAKDLDSLLQIADKNMYKVKQERKKND